MNKALQFLKENKTFYLATVEKDQPRVRPFGAVAEFEGKLYICTNNTKAVFKQIRENDKVEISACGANGTWIRLSAKAVPDSRREAKQAMLEQNPSLSRMYKLDDGIFEVLYLKDAQASICSFAAAPDTFAF